MNKLNVRRNLLMDDIRNMCIKNHFYTRGTCEEYSKLLCSYNGYISDSELEELATDIVEHSSEDSLLEAYGSPFGDISFYIVCIVEDFANNYCQTLAFY